MKLTVLGKYGPYPQKGGGTTSYLMECGKKRILIDAGSGCLARVQQYCSLEEIDMIILTHLHSDHCSEMFILRYALRDKSVNVLLPKTPEKEYGILHACPCYETLALSKDLVLHIPETDIEISFCRTIHPVECYAVKIQKNGRSFVFSGDSRYSDDLTAFCQNADVLLCDSGFLSSQEDTGVLPHMYVCEAALTAQKAKVGQLLLTHINPAYEESEILREAAEIFANVQIVAEQKQYLI